MIRSKNLIHRDIKAVREIIKKRYPMLLPKNIQWQLEKAYSVIRSECKICCGTETVYEIIQNPIRILTARCDCSVRKSELDSIDKAIIASNIPQKFLGATIDCWHNVGSNAVEIEHNERKLDIVRSYCRNIARMRKAGYGLYFSGPTGVGKTYLAAAIGIVAINSKYTVLYFTASKIIQCVIEGWKNEDAREVSSGIEAVDFLIIDDLDKVYRSSSGFSINLFDGLLRERIQRGMPCIITSNVAFGDIGSQFGQHVQSMLMEHACEIVFIGNDYREGISNKIIREITNGDS